MIGFFETKEKLNELIITEIEELKLLKSSYENKQTICMKCTKSLLVNVEKQIEAEKSKEILEQLGNDLTQIYRQIQKIESTLNLLYSISYIEDLESEMLQRNINIYNEDYNKIKECYRINCADEEQTMVKYLEIQSRTEVTQVDVLEEELKTDIQEMIQEKVYFDVENNDILLISEIQNKVILPYHAKEIREALKNESDKYRTAEEVVNDKFVRPLDDFRHLHSSRARETIQLLTKREKYSKIDAIFMATEMFSKRYLHPAIIAACRNLDELDVYLDCLDKNELDDFKIFKIKYEIYPVAVKNSENSLYAKTNMIKRIANFFKRTVLGKRKSRLEGRRY